MEYKITKNILANDIAGLRQTVGRHRMQKEHEIALIVAYAKKRVIGNKGVIPWKIKGEQKRFRDLTIGNVVIMGRRSFEEIGKPLPNRTTIVVSGTGNFDGENCHTARSLMDAINMAGEQNIYIAGGARLYEEALPIVDKMYITEIDLEVQGDTYFPMFDETLFEKQIDAEVDGEVSYKLLTYTRTGVHSNVCD